jgi:hypothetical protein
LTGSCRACMFILRIVVASFLMLFIKIAAYLRLSFLEWDRITV